MNNLYWSLSAGGAVVLVSVLVMRRRGQQARTLEQKPEANATGAQVIWRRGGQELELGEQGSAKRAFLRQLALGSVASVAGWVATRGTNAEWAEKLILSQSTKGPRVGAAMAQMAAAQRGRITDRPLHQDDHYDWISHHYDWHIDDPQGTHNDENPHADETFHDHIDEWIYIGEGGTGGFEHQDWTNDGAHNDGPYHVDDLSHYDETVDFVDHGDIDL